MDKEQRKRTATREFFGTDPDQTEITYTLEVSGDRVEISRTWEEESDNESGTGKDIGHDCWIMSKDDLKKFVECANWTIQQSEAFEAAHPKPKPVARSIESVNEAIDAANKDQYRYDGEDDPPTDDGYGYSLW